MHHRLTPLDRENGH